MLCFLFTYLLIHWVIHTPHSYWGPLRCIKRPKGNMWKDIEGKKVLEQKIFGPKTNFLSYSLEDKTTKNMKSGWTICPVSCRTFGPVQNSHKASAHTKMVLDNLVLSRIIWRTSLVVQRLRICLPMQGAWVQSLVQGDSTCFKATTRTPQLLSPRALEPTCSATREATTPQV